MENKNKFWRGVMVGVLVTAFAGLVTVGASAGIYMFGRNVIGSQAGFYTQEEKNTAGEQSLQLDQVKNKLSQLQLLVDQYYLFEDEIETEKEESGIYQGFLYGLNDPYAVYYTKEELQSFMDETAGSYCGIGAMVSQNITTGVATIIRVFEGSPAEQAGIRPGDVIYKVDGEEVTGVDLTLIVNNYVKGEEGTEVVITVFREEEEETYQDITVTRSPIDVQTVSGKMLEDGIGYISVLEFDQITDSQFKAQIEALQEQGMEKLIVDLRDNPGGELTTVVSMVDYVIEDGGRILTVADKYGKEEIYQAEDGHRLDLPIVVLVNENSASASEVFTGALKDYGAALIVGTKTFGKGIVQTLLPLSDGSAVKLTTNHYYTPEGHDIHGKGIEPDVEIELNEEAAVMPVIPEELDNQLQKAIELLKEE